ncbi:T9SS type A sorting domain-containing protein [bacterium]|nr:T9SS type A sorting domain-containing protein [bacterium]
MRAQSRVQFWGILILSFLFPLLSFATIQEMIDAAEDGDIILVEAGTYVENIDFGDKNLTLRSVSGPEVTIIDGNNNGSVVMLHGGQSENTVLDGFTITNGSGWHNGEEYVGGGVAIRFDSSPTLRNLIISDNHATGAGDPGGGGITIALNSNPYLENIVIRGNNSAWGGGVAVRESNPTFRNVDIYDNHASITGGGIYVGVESNPVFESVNVYSNTAVYYGGGAFIHDHSNPTFNKTTFTQNTSPSGGGGMILNHGSAVMVINSIFWGNLPDQLILNNDPAYQPDELMVAYSDIQDGEAGIDPGLGTIEWLAGNIESDPLLDGLCIEPESPCIDAGVAYFAYHGVTYVDMSEDEYYGLAPDMGSCETNFGPQIIMVPGDYATIQAAIDAATEADTVVVSAGTYVENIDFNGNDIKVRSESGPDVTIIDGDMNGSTVMFISEEGLGAVLDGFTITNGNGWWNGEERIGGGILVRDGSSPTLKNLVITGNVVDSGTDPIGGGICISMGSNPSLQNIVISNNDADWAGGIAIVYANPTLADIEIFGNQATTTAGGMFVGDLAHPSLERITVHNNYAAFYAGGIFLHNRANVTLDHFTVTNNSCGTSGGGLTVNHNSNPVITNSIFWGNWPDEILLYDDEEFDPNTITISYSDVQNGQWGIGLGNGTLNWDEASNIGAEFEDYPLFCDPESAVFTLAEYSPCAGSGLDGVNMGAWDVACSDPVALDPESDILPEVFGLHQNYPNPFNPSTTINYDLPVDGWVSLKIYDLSGREVNTLISSEKAAGYHSLEWNAVDAQGNSIESGIYLYQLNFRDANGSDTRSTRKFSLLK